MAQECISHKAQSSGVFIAEGTELRSVYHTEHRAWDCESHRVQTSGGCIAQGAGLGSVCHIGSGLRSLYALHRVQEYVLNRGQGLGVGNTQAHVGTKRVYINIHTLTIQLAIATVDASNTA